MKPEQVIRTMGKTAKRFSRLHEHVRTIRRPHYFNEATVGPKLAEPLAHIDYQSDIIRQTLVQLKARLQENHGIVHVTPRHQGADSANADAVEAAFNAMWTLIEERNGTPLQADMVDGQFIDGYSILHWYRMDQTWPEVPEYEWLDELPEDGEYDTDRTKRNNARTRARFEREPREDGKHRETDASLQERTNQKRARAGSPYHAEVCEFFSVFFARDALYDIGPVLHIKRIPLDDYNEELKDYGKQATLSQAKIALRDLRDNLESTPGAAPRQDSPSGMDYGETITVGTVWTRSEWYEFCTYQEFTSVETMDATAWEFVKSGKHGFGRVPFEIVPGDIFNSDDPLERYQPIAEGLFRMKPNHDRMTAIQMGLAERIALQDTWFERVPGAEPGLTEDGQDVTVGTDSQSAGTVPEGYRLQHSNFQMNNAFPMVRDQIQSDMEKARPSTGEPIGGISTAPWTMKMSLDAANVQPRMYMGAHARALRAMWRSIARDISTPAENGGFGEPVVVYARGEENEETDRIVGIDPEDVETLFIDISIDGTSMSERTTSVEHGASLLARKLVTRRTFYEDYMGYPNASDYMLELDAELLKEQYLKPGIIAQALAEEFGAKSVFTPDGKFVGFNGQEANPDQMAQGMGYSQVPAGVPNPAGPAGNPSIPPLVDTPLPGQQPRMPMQP